MLRNLALLSPLLLLTQLAVSAAPGDILIADFEGPDYGDWVAEGTAFGKGPAQGTLPGQMKVSGFQGKGLVNSFLGGDKSTGRLTSAPFEIQRDFLNFLVGGGMHPGQTCMNLLIEGKVVRTATGPNDRPGGTERLERGSWDVREFKGKQAVIQIVDQATGGWGHINVDSITQSDKQAKPAYAPAQREVKLDKRYLLFPISNDGNRCRLTLTVDDQVVHDFDINLAADQPDWWSHVDVSQYAGRTALLNAGKLPTDSKGFGLIETADTPRHLQPLYDEALRPQLRFSQARGWNNDPNGMVYYDGEYHLFWQSNPFGWKWANMYWGHAVSTDLVHWRQLPYALYPRVMAKGACFSGSANVDAHNSGGWQTGDEKTLVAAFTDTGSGEAIAVSTDRGRSWKYVDENPVLKHRGRDPNLEWYAYGPTDTPLNDAAKKLGGHWVLAVFDDHPELKRNIAFYTSTNLKDWQEQSHLPGYFECPELLHLPVEGKAEDSRWVVFAADARYAIGTFDGKTFTPEHEGKHRVHYGAFYASQCFSNAPGGRAIQIGWARINMPGMPFNQAFTLPIELTLKTTPEGLRLFAQPIQELEALREKPLPVQGDVVTPEQPIRLETEDQLFDLVVTVAPKGAKEIRLKFGENEVKYDTGAGKLDEMPLPLRDGKLTFRVLIDRPMYEICGGEGEVYKTAPRKDGGKPLGAITLSAVGGQAAVKSLRVYPMRSIWTSTP